MAYPRQIRGDVPPPKPGVCVLFTAFAGGKKNYAFISQVANVRVRLQAWEYHFRHKHEPDYKPVVTGNLPDIEAGFWKFGFWLDENLTLAGVTKIFVDRGYEILSNPKRARKITYKGKHGTLAQLCREFGVDYQSAYYRMTFKGATYDDVFGKDL